MTLASFGGPKKTKNNGDATPVALDELHVRGKWQHDSLSTL